MTMNGGDDDSRMETVTNRDEAPQGRHRFRLRKGPSGATRAEAAHFAGAVRYVHDRPKAARPDDIPHRRVMKTDEEFADRQMKMTTIWKTDGGDEEGRQEEESEEARSAWLGE